MGWLRKSEEVAGRADPLASWGERAAKVVLWIVGPSALSGLAVGAYGWIAANPLYGVLFGFVAFAVMQLALMLRAIRRSAARRGPFAEPEPEEAATRVLSPADSEEVEQLRNKLTEAEQEIEELRIELNNRPPRHFDTPVTVVDPPTPDEADEIEAEKQKLNAEIEELKTQLTEAKQTIRSQRKAMEDEQGVVHWGEYNAVNLGERAANAEAKKKIEELNAQNQRLRKQVASPEVAKQKRLCLHLADDLRALYESFQQDERVLLAQLQKRKAAGATEEELEEERRAKQAEIEKRVVNKYHYGYSDRLEKLYEELEPDGWLGPNDESLFLNVNAPHEIMMVADRLEDVGRKL
jgi:DNA repair exonuclease SbcCD ATPase subunit